MNDIQIVEEAGLSVINMWIDVGNIGFQRHCHSLWLRWMYVYRGNLSFLTASESASKTKMPVKLQFSDDDIYGG